MHAIEWSDDLSIGNDDIDDEHRHLVERLNDVFAAAGSAKVGDSLDGLIDEVRTHFASEEAALEREGYPDLIAHRNDHARLVKRVVGIRNDLGAAGLSDDHQASLKDWLVDHIKGGDRQYAVRRAIGGGCD
jgi:hemerythrin